MVIAMQDDEAIEKAAALMGVRKTKGNVSKSSGRILWRATVVGARMIEVIEALEPFLTRLKLKQAHDAIKLAMESGYLTRREMKEVRKAKIVSELRNNPGSSTRDLGIRLGIGYSYALKYLTELKNEGRVHSQLGGRSTRPRLDWFIEP